jgi:hypothetical protein
MTRHIGISVPHRRVEDDDDIQEYKKPWVGLTDMERQMVINKHEGVAWETAIAIEQALKEKNT